VLNLNPKPVVGEAIAALGSDLSVALPFLLCLLGLRAGLMLQRRRSLLLQRQAQQRSQQRLRRARRLLEQGLDKLPNRQREQALQLLILGCGDPIDDLARKLELVAQAHRDQQEAPSQSTAVEFEPMRNHQGELQRVHVLAGPEITLERYREAIKAWSNLPAGLRLNLGLQLDLSPALLSNPETLQALIAILHDHNMPPELCTIGIEGAKASVEALRQYLPLWRNAGFALSWLQTTGALDPATWLHKQWVDEVQLLAPGWGHPALITTQQTLIGTLIELAHARGLRVSVRGVQEQEDQQGLWQRGAALVAGPEIGRPLTDLGTLLTKERKINQ
jgi:EAL domain-containing protein (putative c-di-GMP-specific phosphodiesterase class I)